MMAIYWKPWQFIKNDTKLSLILQTDLHIIQEFPLTKLVFGEIFDAAFAWLIFQYQF
jgi:hypothetical protein